MDDQEAYDFYSNPANRLTAGPGVKRAGQPQVDMNRIRFTTEVIEAVKRRASDDGTTVGSWIRRVVSRELDSPRDQALQTFMCPHLTVSGAESAACLVCGPLHPAVP